MCKVLHVPIQYAEWQTPGSHSYCLFSVVGNFNKPFTWNKKWACKFNPLLRKNMCLFQEIKCNFVATNNNLVCMGIRHFSKTQVLFMCCAWCSSFYLASPPSLMKSGLLPLTVFLLTSEWNSIQTEKGTCVIWKKMSILPWESISLVIL